MFTEPQAATQEESDSTETPSDDTEEPSPEQEGQEVPVLEAQLKQVVVHEEPELPVPQLPAPVQVALPLPQPAPPIAIMAQQAQQAQLPPMVTTKLKGEAPDVFTGD